jgi:hypothetical protein
VTLCSNAQRPDVPGDMGDMGDVGGHRIRREMLTKRTLIPLYVRGNRKITRAAPKMSPGTFADVPQMSPTQVFEQ